MNRIHPLNTQFPSPEKFTYPFCYEPSPLSLLAATEAQREIARMTLTEGKMFGVMVVETPLDFDWQEAMTRLATLPRQEEWEAYVAMFQDCKPGSTSDQKWQLMERMFYLY